MPELPEVQTVVDGIQEVVGLKILGVHTHCLKLRQPIQTDLSDRLEGSVIQMVFRRAKYIVVKTNCDVLIHLGMTGKLLIKDHTYQRVKHDHMEIHLSNGKKLVYHDPRRFGMVSWHSNYQDYLAHYGVEPLSDAFSSDYLYQHCRDRRTTIKALIMDQRCVVGVGNIYACEALFLAGISPLKQAKVINKNECLKLVAMIKKVLNQAISEGGTTLKDYRTANNSLGYFQQSLNVYGLEGKGCQACGSSIQNVKITGRSTFYCEHCQS